MKDGKIKLTEKSFNSVIQDIACYIVSLLHSVPLSLENLYHSVSPDNTLPLYIFKNKKSWQGLNEVTAFTANG